jgi:hypothetical protein
MCPSCHNFQLVPPRYLWRPQRLTRSRMGMCASLAPIFDSSAGHGRSI